MRKPVILDGAPYIQTHDYFDAKQVFERSGGNTGNMAFRYGVARSLLDTSFLPMGAPPETIRRAGDVAVLPLANQLGAHTNLGASAQRLRDIDLPVLALGLGGQAPDMDQDVKLTEGTIDWLKEICARSPSSGPNIGVRGPYTQRQIEQLGFTGSAVVTGCPSNFINVNERNFVEIEKKFRVRPRKIAVMAGIPHIPRLAKVERDLADIVTASDGAYIVQHGLEMIQLARREFNEMKPETLDLCWRYVAPAMRLEEFKLWCEKYAHVMFDIRFWMDYVRRFDFVVGTRFHGAMIALQAGVPSACIAHDSRTLEMCQTMNIPVVRFEDIPGRITRENLLELFSFDAEQYLATRRELKSRYVDILKSADLPLAKDFAS
jgi:hypothetical protein